MASVRRPDVPAWSLAQWRRLEAFLFDGLGNEAPAAVADVPAPRKVEESGKSPRSSRQDQRVSMHRPGRSG